MVSVLDMPVSFASLSGISPILMEVMHGAIGSIGSC